MPLFPLLLYPTFYIENSRGAPDTGVVVSANTCVCHNPTANHLLDAGPMKGGRTRGRSKCPATSAHKGEEEQRGHSAQHSHPYC